MDTIVAVALILAGIAYAARIIITSNRRYLDELRERLNHDLRGPWCARCQIGRVDIEGAWCGYCAARHGRVAS